MSGMSTHICNSCSAMGKVRYMSSCLTIIGCNPCDRAKRGDIAKNNFCGNFIQRKKCRCLECYYKHAVKNLLCPATCLGHCDVISTGAKGVIVQQHRLLFSAFSGINNGHGASSSPLRSTAKLRAAMQG